MCRNFTETSLLKQTNERWVVKVIHHSPFAIRHSLSSLARQELCPSEFLVPRPTTLVPL